MLDILKEIWDFLRVRKKWWLWPIVISVLLAGLLIMFAGSSTMAPIYTLF